MKRGGYIRRWAVVAALLLWGVTGWAALTERYVTAAAAGGGDGSSGSPWTLAEAFAHTSGVGYRVNIQSDGAYSIGATTIAQAGDTTALSVFRGYDATIGDLESLGRNADGTLNTTGMPAITVTGSLDLNSYVVLESLNITGSLGLDLIGTVNTDNCALISCKVLNSANAAGAKCVELDNDVTIVNCDFEASGASHNILVSVDLNGYVFGCRFKGVAASAQLSTAVGSAISNCVFIGNSGVGIGILTEQLAVGRAGNIEHCTFYSLGTALSFPDSVPEFTPRLINNHATDCAKWLDNLYSATANLAVIEINNRTRDNTTPRTGIGDGVLVGEVTTDTGGAETDYTNAGAGNFRLITGAPGVSAGLIDYQDIGAYQQEPAAGGGSVVVILED